MNTYRDTCSRCQDLESDYQAIIDNLRASNFSLDEKLKCKNAELQSKIAELKIRKNARLQFMLKYFWLAILILSCLIICCFLVYADVTKPQICLDSVKMLTSMDREKFCPANSIMETERDGGQLFVRCICQSKN